MGVSSTTSTKNLIYPGIEIMQWIFLFCFILSCAQAIEPNFEDVDESKEQPQNEVVNIDQDSPHSNAVHIAHNIPTGSDITVKQKNPYNSTVHIALNIAKDCKVKVEINDAVNSILHVSLSFQNPGTTSV